MAIFYTPPNQYQKPIYQHPTAPNIKIPTSGVIPGPNISLPNPQSQIPHQPPSNVPKISPFAPGSVSSPGQSNQNALVSRPQTPTVQPRMNIWQQTALQSLKPTIPQAQSSLFQKANLTSATQSGGLQSQPQATPGRDLTSLLKNIEPANVTSLLTPQVGTKTSQIGWPEGWGTPSNPNSSLIGAITGTTPSTPPKALDENPPWKQLFAPTKPSEIGDKLPPLYTTTTQYDSLGNSVYGALPQNIQNLMTDISNQKKNVLDLLDIEKNKALNDTLARLSATGNLSQSNVDAIALATEAQYAAKKAAMAAELEQQKIQNELAATQALGQLAESQGNLYLKSWAQQYQAFLEQRQQALNERRALFEEKQAKIGDFLTALYDLTVIKYQIEPDEFAWMVKWLEDLYRDYELGYEAPWD